MAISYSTSEGDVNAGIVVVILPMTTCIAVRVTAVTCFRHAVQASKVVAFRDGDSEHEVGVILAISSSPRNCTEKHAHSYVETAPVEWEGHHSSNPDNTREGAQLMPSGVPTNCPRALYSPHHVLYSTFDQTGSISNTRFCRE